MSEENKGTRLSKAAKEFNIAVGTVIGFLTEKGFEVDSNPNSRITEEMYLQLEKAFQSDKVAKIAAEKIGLDFQKKETITLEENTKPAAKNEEEEEYVVIKSTIESSIKPSSDTEKVEDPAKTKAPAKKEITPAKKDTAPTKKEVAPTKKEVAPAKKEVAPAKKEETPAEIATPTEIATPADEVAPTQTIPDRAPTVENIPAAAHQPLMDTQNVPAETNENDNSNGPRVLGKIDLSSINDKTRPNKKSKAELQAERSAKINEEKNRKYPRSDAKTEGKSHEHAAAKSNHKVEKTEAPAPSAPKAETPKTEAPKAEERLIEHIKTEYQTLEGPKMTGQVIDLSQFDKKKSSGHASANANAKKKRDRIKKEGGKSIDIKQVVDHEKSGHKKDAKGGKKERPKHVEIDNTEIEKQIKETLARLGNQGKSKFSKHRRDKRSQVAEQLQAEMMRQQEEQGILKVTEFVTANELATMMNVPVTQIIATCMSVGQFVSINQRLNAEVISLLAEEYGFKLEFVGAEVMEAITDVEEVDAPEDMKPRPPIVTVMGHVDHGKTSLLDHIRKENVIAGEAGGITQHIGAYEVTLDDGRKITFLDTPGHEAFTAMRARGAKVTDLAIIVIAADDRIMPQTIEAINHAQAGNVPIVFAINKIDKPGADPNRIKQELAEMNLLVEEWGGKYQSQDISAKKGENMGLLLEKVLLEAELLDLKANPDKRAKGTIIEASLDKGRGYVANVLIQDGSIRIGDNILAGTTYGRVKAMYNERNQLITYAGPSTPILLLGLNGAPQAGDIFNVTPSDKEAKEVANRRTQLQREQGLRTQKHITLDEIGRRIAIGDFKELNIIVKGDVDGSVEALSDSLLKLSTPEVQVNVIHKAVGQISEGDVVLASASDALIIGFQVRPSMSARRLAEAEQIDIRLYSIIYKAIEEVKDAIEGMLAPDVTEKILCNLEVKETFHITKVGTVAGCIVLDGKISRSTKIRIIRDGIVVYTGKLGSLKRFKDEVKEAVSGQDCGLNIDNFNDIKAGDIIEGYDLIETKRTL